MRLYHNLASLNIYNEQSKIIQKQSKALSRISSGLKVNSAKDNPDALAQSERLRMQIRGVQMASRNTQDGVSMLQTAEGTLGSINDYLGRIRELTVQAGSGANSPEDKKTIQTEIDQMIKGINDAANNMEFNGVKLLAHDMVSGDDAANELSMSVGANKDEVVKIPMCDLRIDNLSDKSGNLLKNIDVTAPGGVDNALKVIDGVIDNVLSINSKYGAIENRLDSSFNDLNEISDRMEGADSSLRDADIAEEMMEFSKDNILAEAGTALMAQTNRLPQDILRILENMRR